MITSKRFNDFQRIAVAVFVIFACAVNCNPSNKPSESAAEYKVVETENGKVRGMRKTTLIKGVDYYSFKGVPYAKSPIGELRFKAPEPVKSWAPKVLDAFEHGLICTQQVKPQFRNFQPQSEDCLFLNIYVPADANPNEKLAVMIFIHGGGYSIGSGNDDTYGPDFLLEQRGVILVTLNYRLGAFGFLSLGTPEYSGNMGLKDQQLALKWVHSNIEHFSGDNQRITVFGESAGGSSTHFQVLSSESRQYFKRAIPMSGSVNNNWAWSANNDHLALVYQIAQDSGKSNASFAELVELLKTLPANKTFEYETDGFQQDRTGSLQLAPVVENRNAVRPFITDSPDTIYDEAKIDIDAFFTYCSAEFIIFYYLVNMASNLKGLDRNFSVTFPFKERGPEFDSPEYEKLAQEIRQFYFKDAAVDKSTLNQYVDLFSDINFVYAIDKSAKQHAEKSSAKTFYLQFSVDSALNVIKRSQNSENLRGASHADELCYLFRCAHAQGIYDAILKNKDNEQSIINLRAIENMTKLFTNFAKYGEPTNGGNPVGGLLPIQNGRANFVNVTNDGLQLGVGPRHEAIQLWTRIEQEVRQITHNSV